MTTIDGKNAILGRLASKVAKQLLRGESVSIINAERIIVTGSPSQIKEKYLARRRRGSAHHGPFYPTRPDLIVRRTVRGMLPYKTNKGRNAFKNLRVYVGTLQGTGEAQKMEASIKSNYITVGEIAKTLGWRE